MELSKAQTIAKEVQEKLAPFCSRIQIAGSIRRKRPFVRDIDRDIDMVLIPSNQGAFIAALQTLGKIKMGGAKLIRCQLPQTMLDVYVATPDIWATLLLIRTGSAKHNIRLCSLAKQKGMKLHADGSGLFRVSLLKSEPDERIAVDTERSIFEALGLAYKEPEERE